MPGVDRRLGAFIIGPDYMEQFVIEGEQPLHGTVTPAGNKNAALPLLAACLLTSEPVVLHNVPSIQDVDAMRQIVGQLGATVEELEPHTWRLHTPRITAGGLSPEICRSIRASILVAGPMLARHGWIDLPLPGGDLIGRRRLDTHLVALEGLGATVRLEDSTFHMQAAERGLRGARVLLDECSVTATENAVMAAALAKGATEIPNA